MLISDLADQLSELIYDAQHEHCEDECTGGGRLWYRRVADRLTDPVGPLAEIANEREMQDAKWGEQNHPDGTGHAIDEHTAVYARQTCQDAFKDGRGTWRHILDEETAEAYAEKDPAKLRTELMQVAAVAVAWIEAIDRRSLDARPNVEGGAVP
jgi:hypothetical protein